MYAKNVIATRKKYRRAGEKKKPKTDTTVYNSDDKYYDDLNNTEGDSWGRTAGKKLERGLRSAFGLRTEKFVGEADKFGDRKLGSTGKKKEKAPDSVLVSQREAQKLKEGSIDAKDTEFVEGTQKWNEEKGMYENVANDGKQRDGSLVQYITLDDGTKHAFVPLPEAEVAYDMGEDLRQKAKSGDPIQAAMAKDELKVYNNLGAQGVLDDRQMKGSVRDATTKFAQDYVAPVGMAALNFSGTGAGRTAVAQGAKAVNATSKAVAGQVSKLGSKLANTSTGQAVSRTLSPVTSRVNSAMNTLTKPLKTVKQAGKDVLKPLTNVEVAGGVNVGDVLKAKSTVAGVTGGYHAIADEGLSAEERAMGVLEAIPGVDPLVDKIHQAEDIVHMGQDAYDIMTGNYSDKTGLVKKFDQKGIIKSVKGLGETASNQEEKMDKHKSRRGGKRIGKITRKKKNAGGLKIGNSSVADMISAEGGGGKGWRSILEDGAMSLAGKGQDLVGNLKDGLKGANWIGKAGDIAGNLAEKKLMKGSATAHDDFRTDKSQRKAAGVSGAIKGAAKGAEFGKKFGPWGAAIGAVVGGVGGLIKNRRNQEKERKAAVRSLRETQAVQLKAEAAGGDPFAAEAGAGFNKATSATKAYDQVSTAKLGGVKKLPGGNMKSLPGGAVEFNGQSHEQGGIMLDQYTEVEGGETMDKVKMKKEGGTMKDYIFSDHLKLGGVSFAKRHKDILERGGSQKEIQELAAMQEKKAGRTPKIAKLGGVTQYEGGGEKTPRQANTNELLEALYQGNFTEDMTSEEKVKELNRAATEAANQYTEEEVAANNAERERILAENEAKMAARAEKGAIQEQDPETGKRIYGGDEEDNIGNWLEMMERDQGNLPEEFRTFDFDAYKDDEGNFDPAKFNTKAEKSKFRTWYNELPDDLVTGKISADNDTSDLYFGQQWNSRRLLQRPPTPEPLEREEVQVLTEIPEPVEGDTPEPPEEQPSGGGGTKVKKHRDVPLGALLAGASQLIPPAYALMTKAPTVPGYAPQAYAKPQLPRVNYNAERSSNASDLRATMASIENNAAGPAGMVNMIAALGKKRQGDLQIATAESRANKELSAEEARMGQQTSEFNIGQDAKAQEFNRKLAREQIKTRREEKLGALDAMADRIAGITGDVLDYKGQERLAEATSGETGVLLRERLKGKTNPNTGKPYTQEEINAIAAGVEEKAASTAGTGEGEETAQADGKEKKKRGRKNKEGKTKSVPQPGDEAQPKEMSLREQQRQRVKDARAGSGATARKGGYIRRAGGIKRRRR